MFAFNSTKYPANPEYSASGPDEWWLVNLHVLGELAGKLGKHFKSRERNSKAAVPASVLDAADSAGSEVRVQYCCTVQLSYVVSQIAAFLRQFVHWTKKDAFWTWNLLSGAVKRRSLKLWFIGWNLVNSNTIPKFLVQVKRHFFKLWATWNATMRAIDLPITRMMLVSLPWKPISQDTLWRRRN